MNGDFGHGQDLLEHAGVSKRDGAEIGSGRYLLGSGENPYQRLGGLYGEYRKLHKQGISDGDIAASLGMSSGEMRARLQYYQALKSSRMQRDCIDMLDNGMSKLEISKKLGVSPTTVSKYVEAASDVREAKIISTRNALKDKVDEVGWVDVGKGTENLMHVKRTMLDAACITLQDEGYELHSDVRVRQGGSGNYTTMRVLAKPGMTRGDVLRDKDNPDATMADIKSRDQGLTYTKKGPVVNVPSSRVQIRYGDDEVSGKDMDGVIELRRGVPDLDLGSAHYAQVRIGVDHNGEKLYAKGMAVYADDLPEGVDIRVNSNKARAKGISGALKQQKPLDPKDPDGPRDEMNPFGTNTKEDIDLKHVTNFYIDKDGKQKQSALNFVNEEGGWEEWDKNLPSQFLGKQPPALAKQQLNIAADAKQREFDQIKALTNPVLRESMLIDFSQTCDSAAEKLKAASLPRQATAVIVPSKSLKENQIYAPRLQEGEEVCLVRFPHGGTFEIPRLTVTHKNPEAEKRIGNAAIDAVCINPKTASILSGADFDGDTVLVLPTKKHGIVNMEPLKGLKDFDTQTMYATTKEEREKLNIWDKGTPREQTEMGKISNLITDMTIQNATEEELARAVRHSMVIIDTGKHKLNYKRSAQENQISELVKKYQPHYDEKTGKMKYGGASTLLSKAGKEVKVEAVKSYKKIDPETGKYVTVTDTEMVPSWKKTKERNPETGMPIYEFQGYKSKQRKSTYMRETDDAHTLSTGTVIEGVYADYANRMKAMGNEARKEALKAKQEKEKKNSTASKTYAKEVDHLKYQLNEAKKNAPLERKAQAIAQAKVELAKQACYGDMTKGEESKMLDKELKRARDIVGASRYRVTISDKEWEAIQAGAVAPSTQADLFRFADKDQLRQLAMPKQEVKLKSSYIATAKTMLANGYSLEEVARRFDVSPSTLSKAVNE